MMTVMVDDTSKWNYIRSQKVTAKPQAADEFLREIKGEIKWKS